MLYKTFIITSVCFHIGSSRGRLIHRIQRRFSHIQRRTHRHHRPSTLFRQLSIRLHSRRPRTTRNRHRHLRITINTREAPKAVTPKSPATCDTANRQANCTRNFRRHRSKTPKNRHCFTNSERSRKRIATSTLRLLILISTKRWTLRRRVITALYLANGCRCCMLSARQLMC